jgi:hypothetical protein
MKKALIILFGIVLLSGCGLQNKAGVEVMSYPSAKVYIDGKDAGTTPYKNTNLNPGEIEIKLETSEAVWTKNIKLKSNISTVIDWELNKNEEKSGGYILYMEKTGDNDKAGLIVTSVPDKTAVTVSDEIKGYTPVRLGDIGEGERQISLSFPGYKTIDVFAKAVKGYQLIIEARLKNGEEMIVEPTLTTLAEPTKTILKKVMIKPTETGWLKVRAEPSSVGIEMTRVNPGEEYELVSEERDWYKIRLKNGETGWISAKYAEKL